mmetsp:Transcript_77446/g.227106  ORF Transcript_77446/g.227106 Transcript_77446/m.227106 type:complete len:280 (-) Transcript_77446:225-1064(-)
MAFRGPRSRHHAQRLGVAIPLASVPLLARARHVPSTGAVDAAARHGLPRRRGGGRPVVAVDGRPDPGGAGAPEGLAQGGLPPRGPLVRPGHPRGPPGAPAPRGPRRAGGAAGLRARRRGAAPGAGGAAHGRAAGRPPGGAGLRRPGRRLRARRGRRGERRLRGGAGARDEAGVARGEQDAELGHGGRRGPADLRGALRHALRTGRRAAVAREAGLELRLRGLSGGPGRSTARRRRRRREEGSSRNERHKQPQREQEAGGRDLGLGRASPSLQLVGCGTA